MTETTTETLDWTLAADFDLDAAIAGAKRPQRTVRVLTRGDLRDRLDEIERAANTAKASDDPERGMDEPSAETLLEEFRNVRDELLAEAIPFRLRAVTELEVEAANKAAKKAGDDDTRSAALHSVAAAIVSPPTTVRQLHALREAVGDGEIDKLIIATNELRRGMVVPAAPFSRSSSSGRSTSR